MFPRNFRIDTNSFWLGFLGGVVFAWFVGILRRYLPKFIQFVRRQILIAREKLTASTESRLLNDMIRLAQRQHLAAGFFALDEILIEPRLLAPPPPVEPGGEHVNVSIANQILPYLPDWPELAAALNAPTLSLAEALQGGSNLILMGQAGSGKTVALAHLTCAAARGEARRDAESPWVPLLVHVADLPLSTLGAKSPGDSLLEALTLRVSALTMPRLPALLNNLLESGRALLLLDGLDEIPPASFKQIADFLGALLKRYPAARIVVATAEFYDGLTSLGFIPVAIAAWTDSQRTAFIEQWGKLWSRSTFPDVAWDPEEVNPLMVKNWLLTEAANLSPLEITLKVWAAFAGDALGADPLRAIEAYLRRMVGNIPNGRQALELLARQIVVAINPLALQKEAENWVYEFDQPASFGEPQETGEGESVAKKQAARPVATRVIPALVSNGLLVGRAESRLSFAHPVFMGYLAGAAFAKMGGAGANIQNQPDWPGKAFTLLFLACFSDVSSQVSEMFNPRGDPLQRSTLTAARWLRLAPKNVPWRNPALRQLVNLLQKESPTLGIAARTLTALALAGEPSLANLFRQLLVSDLPNVRLLAILGCALMRDAKSINDLTNAIEDGIPSLGQAACLALGAIGAKEALDAVAYALLEGNESIQLTAAEVLAHLPETGHPLLEEGIKSEDLMVRRAAVTGLAHVHRPWAVQQLEHIAVEDGQWVVRNAAAQALDDTQRPNPHIPKRMPSLHETPWLIAYAAKFGMGVTPGKPAVELLVKALKDGDEDQKIAALAYLRLRGAEDSIIQLYNTFYASEGALHEAAFDALWHIAATGIDLPSPTQFGLG
jgi:HEAT repeat protein